MGRACELRTLKEEPGARHPRTSASPWPPSISRCAIPRSYGRLAVSLTCPDGSVPVPQEWRSSLRRLGRCGKSMRLMRIAL